MSLGHNQSVTKTMDLKLERENSELVVIRSSSCVIKIRETSSIFKSCHSDSQVTQNTQVFQAVKKKVNHKPDANSNRVSYSDEEDVVERSPVGNEKSMGHEEAETSPLLPENVLKLIAPSIKEIVQSSRSHRLDEYDMLEILTQVLNELKSDCINIFKKREYDRRDENVVKHIIRECFTEIMTRYSTTYPSSSRGSSYNRCQKIISRSIKRLTLECVQIIETAITKQAKAMRKNRAQRETTKSLLVKLMQIIQTELNTSKPVLKVVNTELHQPSFQYIFGLLKYFIEMSALRFKRSAKKGSNTKRMHEEGAGEMSSICEINGTIADQKLQEYDSRLDRLIEKASSESPQENSPLLINCYHCTTKCKEQDLLLKTVTRFTEEVKKELMSHAIVVQENSPYCYLPNSNRQNHKEIVLSNAQASTLEAYRNGVRGDFHHERSNSVSPSNSPLRNSCHQQKRLPTPASEKQRNAISTSLVHTPLQSENNVLQFKSHIKQNIPCKLHNLNSKPTPAQKCNEQKCNLQGSSTRRCCDALNITCAHGGSTMKSSAQKMTGGDDIKTCKHGTGDKNEKSRVKITSESPKTLNHKIIPKEEQFLVKKSKPPKKSGKSVKEDEPGNGNNDQTADVGNSPERSSSPDDVTPKNVENVETKPPETVQQEKNVTIKTSPQASLSSSSKVKLAQKKEPSAIEVQKEPKPEDTSPNKPEQKLKFTSDPECSTIKDPAHCCKSNCNCRNRSENQSTDKTEPPKRDSINPMDQDKTGSCCKGCNCGHNSIPVFMNGCMCTSGNTQNGDMGMRPIYQFFANPVPLPCKCQEAKEQKEVQTSRPVTPKGKRESEETSTQTGSQPSSSAPSKSVLSSSAPSSYATSSGPSGYTTTSSSEPSYLTSSSPTSTPSRSGKSGSIESCTCSMDKQSSEYIASKSGVKDACTSDTNCCCPEKIEEVFQEFDDKYSHVVREIKFLIREGYIPLNKEETKEISVTATTSSDKGTSTKSITCRCKMDTCRRCCGNPLSTVPRYPILKPKPTTVQEEQSGIVCEEVEPKPITSQEEQTGILREAGKKQTTFSRASYDNCEDQGQVSKDTLAYNELQKDIQDLKELVKKTRFGNCPCCKCCNCGPESLGKPNPKDGSENIPQQESDGLDKSNLTAEQKRDAEKLADKLHHSPGQSQGQPSNPTAARTTLANIQKPGDSGKAANLDQTIPSKLSDDKEDQTPDKKTQAIKVGKRLPDGVLQYKNSQDPVNDQAVPVKNQSGQVGNPESHQTHLQPTKDAPQTSADRLVQPGASKTLGSQQPSMANKTTNDPSSNQAPTDPRSPNYLDDPATRENVLFKSKVAEEESLPGGVPSRGTASVKSTYNLLGSGSSEEASHDQNEGALPETKSLSSSTVKDGSMDKVGSKTNQKKVGINEYPNRVSISGRGSSFGSLEDRTKVDNNEYPRRESIGGAGTSFGSPEDRTKPEFRETKKTQGPEQVPQSTLSNMSFESKSALSTTSSKTLAFSRDQEAVFQSREKLRGFKSESAVSPSDDCQGFWDKYEDPKEQETCSITRDDQTRISSSTFCGKGATGKAPHDGADADSIGGSSGDSVSDICRNLLNMDPMPCRFWSDEITPPRQGIETYVMVMETEIPTAFPTKDETFIISDRKPIQSITKPKSQNEDNKDKSRTSKKVTEAIKDCLIQKSGYFASKSTSTIWKGITSPIDIIKGLCNIPSGPAALELPTEMPERELPQTCTEKPIKKADLPLIVPSHFHKCKTPKTDDTNQKGEFGSSSLEPTKKLERKANKEVQVTKWNAMTQTAGPRKFNRTDISSDIEDKLARYLGLERMIEDPTTFTTEGLATIKRSFRENNHFKLDGNVNKQSARRNRK